MLDLEHSSRKAFLLEGASNYYLLEACFETPADNSPPAMTLRDCSNISVCGTWFTYWERPTSHSVEIVNCKDIRFQCLATFNSPVFARIERAGREPELIYTVPQDQWKGAKKDWMWLPNLTFSR
jgi:hypothetical protein